MPMKKILAVVALLVVVVAVLIPGFIAIGKCGSFGAGYTGCLLGTQCACNIVSTDSTGKQTSRCIKTTQKGCEGFYVEGKTIALFSESNGKCTTADCTTTA